MNDQQLDEYFVKILNASLKTFKEAYEYETKFSDKSAENNKKYYKTIISSLEKSCSKVKTIDDLGDLGEDAITFAYEAIAAYTEAFIISADPDQREKDLEEYENLEELLYIFCDDDEEDDEED